MAVPDSKNPNTSSTTHMIAKNIAIKISSKLMESDLGSLPFEWIEHYSKFIKAPWEKYPDINPNDMFWRMGKGEDAISIFARYYNSLNKTEKNNFKTKYEQGFVKDEIKSITEMFPVLNMDKFNDALNGITAMMIDNEVIIYHCDIEKALLCGIENRKLTSLEWD